MADLLGFLAAHAQLWKAAQQNVVLSWQSLYSWLNGTLLRVFCPPNCAKTFALPTSPACRAILACSFPSGWAFAACYQQEGSYCGSWRFWDICPVNAFGF